jgi:hypothetical protein
MRRSRVLVIATGTLVDPTGAAISRFVYGMRVPIR